MRSKLFVPGSRPELFDKAMKSQADAISIDLEDAVTATRKAEARRVVREFLLSTGDAYAAKVVIVRVNPASTPEFEADVDAIVQKGVAIVNLPKPTSVDEVRAACDAIDKAAVRNGAREIGVLLNIETPYALRHAALLATAHPRVVGLQVGYADLFEPLGIHRMEVSAVQQVMFAVSMAAGEAGVFAVDGAFVDVADEEGYLAESRLARKFGFVGKTCIHPRQVAMANEAFLPTAEDIEKAWRIVEAADAAMEAGLGAFLVDGKMVDAPILMRAKAMIEGSRSSR